MAKTSTPRTRTETLRVAQPGASYEIRVYGAEKTPLRDFYHVLLRTTWPATFGVLIAIYLAMNTIFAGIYLAVGGIANARAHSFADAFFFSVQTMGTIGYGALSPESPAANVVVVAESIVSLFLTALTTGLVFAKFSRPTARIVFTREVAVGMMDGKRMLSFRFGNQRQNQIVDVQIRMGIVRTETTVEGKTFYRMIDLPLVRARALSLSRSFTAMHVIDETSPLFGSTAESLLAADAELSVMVVGLDDTTMQPVHAAHRWFANQFRFDARHVDILTEESENLLVLDLRRFHELEESPLTEASST